MPARKGKSGAASRGRSKKVISKKAPAKSAPKKTGSTESASSAGTNKLAIIPDYGNSDAVDSPLNQNGNALEPTDSENKVSRSTEFVTVAV